jgi:nickel-dependent lactate racemase
VKDEDITLLCATGSHRRQTEEEHKILLGKLLSQRFQVVDHDCRDVENLINIGTTSFGTPVLLNRTALESDHIVLTGAIVFHDLVGFGGGKKSILPGIAAYESIMANHKLSLSPNEGEGTNCLVRCGNVVDNPVHLDMLEAAAFVKPTFLFNVMIDENGKIAQAVAGNYIEAHKAGQRMVDKVDSAYIKELADIIVVSAGGYPKDIDFYQASKALINAKEAIKKDGAIILLAECMDGFGGKEVQQMLEEFCDNSSREQALRETFSIAKYTGYLIAEIAENYNVILVSSLDSSLLGNANIKTASNVKDAIDLAILQKGSSAKVYFMPFGSNTLPRLI